MTSTEGVGGGGGGVLTLTWYTYICACLLGCYFAKFGTVIGRFSTEMKVPKLHKLGVFGANYGKKHPIWGCFSFVNGIGPTDGWIIVRKIGIEGVKFVRSSKHIHVQVWRKYPLRGWRYNTVVIVQPSGNDSRSINTNCGVYQSASHRFDYTYSFVYTLRGHNWVHFAHRL